MTAAPLPARLAEIEAALAKATPGPWRRNTQPGVIFDSSNAPVASGYTRADAALIVAAVNALPGLLATVREQADAIGRARALADEWVARMDTYLVGLSLRAVLPADHGQDAGEGR